MEVINDVFCTDEVPLIEPEAETSPPPLPSPTDLSPPSAFETSPDDIERLYNWISMIDMVGELELNLETATTVADGSVKSYKMHVASVQSIGLEQAEAPDRAARIRPQRRCDIQDVRRRELREVREEEFPAEGAAAARFRKLREARTGPKIRWWRGLVDLV
ncbi:hypothetical protein RHSIM_Rhsim03G0138200 [Rhododendron simsii]|uniref:Uncharacterized protein n=1 Tax=Rhododendron simsii TaxID=118357 RepID=A0A834H4S1_RHOSS|nr:hypothetical protein RHSIM_Rhsim03G0138200 [Rhododendron simsii]